MMPSTKEYDIIIAGGGLSGLSLTLMLGQAGIKTLCLDRIAFDESLTPAFDGRTTAISFGSRQILEPTNIWEDIDHGACPIETIHILDGYSPVLLDFNHEEVGDAPFGWIVENRLLRQALHLQIKETKAATFLAPRLIENVEIHESHVDVMTDHGDIFSAPLLVGADGRQSFIRRLMNIQTRQWSYRQSAIVCTVAHENPHDHIAVEHFKPEGPFAILPMKDAEDGTHRSSLVWTEHGPRHQSAMRFDEHVFNAALTARFPERYGEVKLLGQRFSYPLGLVHAHKYIADRVALIADAAHGIHPIAGQGLNLGFRDIAVLSDILIDAHQNGRDPGDKNVLQGYERARRIDNMAMAAATDSLNRLFSNDLPGVGLLRRIGLRGVERFKPAKRFFMRQAMGKGMLTQ